MTRNTVAALLAAGTVLAGCTMIPKFERPELPVETQWPMVATAQDHAMAETPAAALRWEEFFRSQPMRDVIQAALTHNRDLRIAALNVEAARATYEVERAGLLPNLSGDIAGSRQRIAQNTPFGGLGGAGGGFISEFYTAEIRASYTLDFFGRIQSLSRAALEQVLATEEARKAAQVSLIAETANAYLQLQADREILKLTEDTLAAQERTYNLILQRFEKGVGTQLEVSQARIPVETARVNHALYTRRVEQDKNALRVLIGQRNADALLTPQSLDSFELMEELPVGLPSQVLLLRPDVRRAEHVLLSANANIGAARAAFFPSISLTGSYGRSSAELGDLFSGGAGTIWSFMPSVSLPIFQGGRNFANLNLSGVNRDIAVAQYERAIQTAFREVADELAARATLDAQLSAQTNLVEATQRAYDVSQARFNQGVDSFLTVLDAQRSLYSAQQSKIEIEKQRLANIVNLYKVLGGGQMMASEEAAGLKKEAAATSADAPRQTTVVTDTPQGRVTETLTVMPQEAADGTRENVAVKTTRVVAGE